MLEVKIDGTELTNVQFAQVSLTRDLDARGEYVGNPSPLHVTIERRCSLQEDRQIAMFLAAKKNPKKVALTIRMLNAAGSDSVVFELTNAFVANWRLINESEQVAYESIELYAGDCQMTAAGGGNKSYKTTMVIPE
ncbi:hypothetical protein J2W42_001136 [Rhizobium tibeticum]|uniref:hypothetical protein n=1 Tax=Rhizobium tibeticum TaxID=501024 RepID=UPI00278010B0|nr:hypothetical protein [Rhizobium tibeticum]MDP9808298.1 hypothetical protein [Rhizobium tibeticum]